MMKNKSTLAKLLDAAVVSMKIRKLPSLIFIPRLMLVFLLQKKKLLKKKKQRLSNRKGFCYDT